MHHYQTTKKSLRDASAFADEVVSHLPVGLIATDSKGNVAFFNAVAEKITGKRGTEVKGQPVDMIIPSKLFDFKNKIDSGKRISEEEIGCRFEDGSKVPLSVSATRITNEVDEFVGHVLILRDMREVRRLQEEVRRQEKLAAVGGLAAGVAHEIRNPLSSIKGMATYFAGLFEEDSHPRKAAEVMIQEVDRLNRTITELLEFARPTNLNRTETDIEPLLHRGLQLIQQDAEAHGVATKLTVSKNLCPVSIDSDRILQCLLNLFLNAIESMEDGGQLNIEADEDTMEKIRICISDTGNCISPENLNNIFNPYFTTKPNGTGLGLAIVHKIITAHNAHLKVVSTPEKGTSFIIWIPCKNSV
jgi:two-component system sensor histidine kinase HydH